MNNKLLLSSALVGGLALTGIASAQTTITGSLDLSYKTISNKGTVTKQTDAGFGRESQVNLANKGKLSNGLDYVAGFSLEFDGKSGSASAGAGSASVTSTQTNIQRISRENMYMDIIIGKTTLSVGMDHLNNMSYSSAPRVAQHADTTAASAQFAGSKDADNAANTGGEIYQFYPGAAALGASNFMGLGIQQVTPIGTITGQYFPKATAQQASNDGVARTDVADAYELHYRGDLGVKGLNANLGYNVVHSAAPVSGQSKKQKGTAMGIGYNMGQFAIGYQRNTTDNGAPTASLTDITSHEIGATFAATKDISIGVTHVKTDGRAAGTVTARDEKIKSLTLGYNLGAITLSATVGELENARGVSGNDSDIVLVRAGTRF